MRFYVGGMNTRALSLISAFACLVSADAALVERDVEYKQDGAVLEGFHVYDDAVTGKRPAVLVVHQWTGLGNYEKKRARMLAELGYNVFAADVYGKGVRPPAPGPAGEEAGKYKNDRALYRGRLMAALEVLQKDERTDPARIAAIGYCFGGAGALELARAGAPLSGVVSFHGSLDAGEGFAAKAGVKMPRILVLHGAADPYSPAAQVADLEKEMKAAGADMKVVLYDGAVHAFTQPQAGDDPSKGAAYNAEADRKSWEAMKNLFAEIFRK
jgi:dienelactone hydrolase